MATDYSSLRDVYQAIPIQDRKKYLQRLNSAELNILYDHPNIFLDQKQIPPIYPWRYHWFRGGRGVGKSFASTSWLYEKIINGAQEVAIVGATYGDLVRDILPVFESHFPKSKRPKFNPKDSIYKCTHYNDCIVKVYSSDTEIRGLNAEYGVAEEMCKWCSGIPKKISECFNIFNLGVRVGLNPQIFISSTPKPFPFFIHFNEEYSKGNPEYSMVIAQTSENLHLSDAAKKSFYETYGNTRLGRQELYGDLLVDNPAALWTSELIEKQKITQQQFDYLIKNGMIETVRSVVTVDPAVSTNINSDETGLIVASLCSDNKVYILRDESGALTPDAWASKAVELYNLYSCSDVVMESNQGGNLLEQAIKTVDRYVRVHLIHASVGKQTRFEPVVMAYERGEVIHVGNLEKLESQMLSYNPYQKNGQSPDRCDAMAYSVYYLLLGQIVSTPAYRNFKNLPSFG